MENLVLYTTLGGMKIVYLKNLSDHIITEVVPQTFIRVLQKIESFSVNWNPSIPSMPQSTISCKDYELEQFLQISNRELMRYDNVSYIELERKKELAKAQTIMNEFKIMVAQKKPDEFIKDLTLEAINDLSNKYAQNFGLDDFIGIETNLSPYQKFFSIISPEDLRFYMTDKIRQQHNDSIIFMGKLICLNPKGWVMYRYENLEYLNELSAKNVTII